LRNLNQLRPGWPKPTPLPISGSNPIGLGLAAGAMILVVSHEAVPETHRNGHQAPAALGLMAGFAVMMVLQPHRDNFSIHFQGGDHG